MRFHVGALAATVLAVSALAGCQDRECDRPDHCLVSARVEGTCQCTEWEVVRTEQVDLPYVVALVLYPVAGKGSSVHYGQAWTHPFGQVYALSPVGARWRTVVREAGGAEQVARVVPGDFSARGWRLESASPQTVSLATLPGSGLAFVSRLDVPTHGVDDQIFIWANPRATVETDYAGGRSIRWSSSEAWPGCAFEPNWIFPLTPLQVLGTQPVADGCLRDFVASLDDRQRAEILSYDGFYAPEGREPQSIFDDPRFAGLHNSYLSFGWRSSQALTWTAPAVADEALTALARPEVPLADGGALVVEHVPFATGAPATFGIVETTETEGCQFGMAVVLDTMFGTAFHMAGTQWDWSGTAACTR